MYSFDNFPSSLGSQRLFRVLWPCQFLEGDTESYLITSVTNKTARPYKTPSRHVPTRPLSILTIVFPVISEEASFLKQNLYLHLPFLTFLTSCLAILATRNQFKFSLVACLGQARAPFRDDEAEGHDSDRASRCVKVR